jgi:hypothetical protein
MGIVAVAVVSWSTPTAKSGLDEALADADENSWRGMWRLRAWWRRQQYCRASIGPQRECHCRQSRIGGTCEEHSVVVLA